MDILPVAPWPTTAVTRVSESIAKDVAGRLPKLTAVVPVKKFPFIVTVVPFAADIGVKELIRGTWEKIQVEISDTKVSDKQ